MKKFWTNIVCFFLGGRHGHIGPWKLVGMSTLGMAGYIPKWQCQYCKGIINETPDDD